MLQCYFRRFYLLVLYSFIGTAAWGQAGGGGSGNTSSVPAAQLPKIVQASPEAAALGRYGDQQLGLSTGTPQVKIPLYELKTKTLALPISLGYSSNGIRVDELASRVGMGWVLNAGGVITRTVYDQPDIDKTRTPAPPNTQFHPFGNYLYLPSAPNSQTTHPTDPQLLSWLEANAPNSDPDRTSSGTDSQYDEFTFNFAGYTGKFILNNQNQPVLLPYSPLKIEYLPTTTTGSNGSSEVV